MNFQHYLLDLLRVTIRQSCDESFALTLPRHLLLLGNYVGHEPGGLDETTPLSKEASWFWSWLKPWLCAWNEKCNRLRRCHVIGSNCVRLGAKP